MLATSERRPRARLSPDGDRQQMLADVRAGLALPQKELQPTWFYDERGSALFEQITRLPEYYLTRLERSLLQVNAPALMTRYAPASIAELGAGSAAKSRILIAAALGVRRALTYVPVDVSASTIQRAANALAVEYPKIAVHPIVADMRSPEVLPADLPRPLLYAFLGSTIGNFTAPEATRLLARMRSSLAGTDRLLVGFDLAKDVAVIEAAYNDTAGVTGEFNRNVLRVLNRELGSDFDVESFAHRAFFNTRLRRVEMHLVSSRRQRVHIPGAGFIDFGAGETIRTEISCKYVPTDIARMLLDAGLFLEELITDSAGWFALAVAASARTAAHEPEREP